MSSSTQLSTKVRPPLVQLAAVSDFKQSDIVRHYGGMNLDTALKSQSLSIGLMSKSNEPEVRLAIGNLFIGTSLYFDQHLQRDQADIIAEELLGNYEYRQLKLEDVVAICIEIREKDIYKLTLAKVISHIRSYTDRRMKKAVQLNQEESDYHKAQAGESNIDSRIMGSARMPESSNEIIANNRVWIQKFK